MSEISFSLRVEGLPLPGFPVESEKAFADYVKGLLGNKSFRVMGLMPGPDKESVKLLTPEQVDKVMEAGGEFNICGNY